VIRADGPFDLAGGLVIQAKDAKTAAEKLVQLQNIVSVAGSPLGLTTSQEAYKGTTITVIDASAFGSLAGGSVVATVAPDGLKIAVAQKDDLVIAGIGVAFVRAVLDTTPGAALADQPGYRDAIGRVGGSNNVQLYVDVAAVMDIAGRHLPADATAAFNANTKPYLAPLRALAVAGAAGDPNRVRLIVTVK